MDRAPAGLGSAWLAFGATYAASVAVVLAQFAVPPLMPVLLAGLGIGLGEAGALMSLFSVTGLLLALPAGLLVQRFGPPAVVAAALLAVVAGCLLAAATADFAILLVSRAVQGAGVGLVGVAAPAIIAAAFPPGRLGTPMGLWSTWVPVGALAMFALAPTLASASGWQAVFVLSAGAAVLALVLFGGVSIGVGLGPRQADRGAADALADLREGLRGGQVWLLAVTFALYALAASAVNTFLPTFLASARGLSLADASRASGLVFAGVAVGAAAGGWLSDRIGSRRLVIVGGLVATAILLVPPFIAGGPLLPVAILAVGLATGVVPAATFAAAPESVPRPHLAAAAIAAVMLGQNAGFVVGPVAFPAVLPALGWTGAAIAFGMVALASSAIAWKLRVR